MIAILPHDGRGMGWNPDLHPLRPMTNDKFGLTGLPNLDKPDHMPWRGPRLFQGGAASCVAFSWIRSLLISQGLADIKSPVLGSPQYLYEIARQYGHRGQDPRTAPPLTDSGCYPTYAIGALRDVGWVKWSDAPYDPSTVNIHVPKLVHRRAYDQRGLDAFTIGEIGLPRVQSCIEAMVRRYTVRIGMNVSKSFMDFTGDGTISSYNPREHVGAHMVTVLRIESNGDVTCDNWWHNWGRSDGTFRLAKSLFMDPSVVSHIDCAVNIPTFELAA